VVAGHGRRWRWSPGVGGQPWPVAAVNGRRRRTGGGQSQEKRLRCQLGSAAANRDVPHLNKDGQP
jgi:hypothetical protein